MTHQTDQPIREPREPLAPDSPVLLDADAVFYPEEDGEPMAETDFQRKPLIYAVEALARHFQHREDVYVSGNLFVYYQEGNSDAQVAPDVFVVFGVPATDRRTYKIWEEGKAPDVVIEITSKATRKQDRSDKYWLYQHMGVGEYFQYDPTGDYLQPPLQGYRLDAQGHYQRLAAQQHGGGILSLASQRLGLELHLEERRMRLYDATQQRYLYTYAEATTQLAIAETQVRVAEARAQWEAEERRKAEARARREAEERRKAEARASTAEARARHEAEERRKAEDELAALKAELERLRGGGTG
jgi:Uma2 family endonuclease